MYVLYICMFYVYYLYACMHVCTCIYMHARMYVYVCNVCMYICVLLFSRPLASDAKNVEVVTGAMVIHKLLRWAQSLRRKRSRRKAASNGFHSGGRSLGNQTSTFSIIHIDRGLSVQRV